MSYATEPPAKIGEGDVLILVFDGQKRRPYMTLSGWRVASARGRPWWRRRKTWTLVLEPEPEGSSGD